MIDGKKIEEAANLHRFELIASMHGSTLGTPMQCSEEVVDAEIDLIENSFIAGAKWADNHPYWHKTEEELPEHGFEVIGYSEGWIDEDFNPKGMRVCYLDDFGWHSAKWNNDQDCWDSVGKEDHICIDCNDCDECKLNADPEWWMDFPKLSPFIED